MEFKTMIRNIREDDYSFIIARLNEWWDGRNMADMLPRLFFIHFQNSSFVFEESGKIIGFLVGFISDTHKDISKWVANSFMYDKARAIKLSTNQRTKKEMISVYDPPEFFDKKAGVCVDLARFGFETLRKIDPTSDPKYLMLEFDPIQIDGNLFQLDWLVTFNRNGMKYFFGDSKRSGYIAGPYQNTQVFDSEYEQYRGRKIVAYRELESYLKQRKSQLRKRRGSKALNKANEVERQKRGD